MQKVLDHLELKTSASRKASLTQINWIKPIEATRQFGVLTPPNQKETLIGLKELPDGWYLVIESGQPDQYVQILGGKLSGEPLDEATYQLKRIAPFVGQLLPELKGTPKQVPWGNQIRARTVLQLFDSLPSPELPLAATKHIFLTEWAHWWIENNDNALTDTLLSIKHWQNPLMRSLVGSLPKLTAEHLPTLSWALRLRLGCVLSLGINSTHQKIETLTSQAYFATKRDCMWWVRNAEEINKIVDKERKEFGKSLVVEITAWDIVDGEYSIPADAPVDKPLAFAKDPNGKWHIHRQDLEF